jgi:hypothetical protein
MDLTNMTDDSTEALKTRLLGIYNRLLDEANEYLDREQRSREAGVVCVAAHRWAIVLDDAGCGTAIHSERPATGGQSFTLRQVRGHLCGTSLFEREGAEAVAAYWSANAPDNLKKVRVILDIDLVKARKADAEAQIAFLKGV